MKVNESLVVRQNGTILASGSSEDRISRMTTLIPSWKLCWKFAARSVPFMVSTMMWVSPGTYAAERAPGTTAMEGPKRVVIPKLAGPITLDGNLDEAPWRRAAVLSPFFRNDGSGREKERTELRLWYDDSSLYLGWTCTDSDIQATFTARDSKFWEEEVVEFFITPKDLTRYFELQWNPLGGTFDAIIKNQLDDKGLSRNFDGDWSFTAKNMRSAVQVKGTVSKGGDKDSFWQVEVKIPFEDLGQATPKVGEVWRGNFYRFNRGNQAPVEELSWSPTRLPSFHEPSRFGYLEFGAEKK